ncbi:MAG: DUF882 domain-containing protein [Gemmatimonadota bacterium]|nr:DUF882 domain-containing protein [Gemmatimonadota bacterium]
MPSIRRIEPLTAVALVLLLGAAALPAFAHGTGGSSRVKPHASIAAPAESVASAAPRGAVEPSGADGLDAVPAAERGDTSTGISGRVRVHLLAPGASPAAVYPVPGGVGGQPFAFIGVVPFVSKQGATIFGYNVGFWPAEMHAVRSDAYENPAGFVEVTAENADTPVSEHFKLRDFVTHDGAPYPKYIVLREALLDKLELVLADLEMQGISTQHVEVLSGFRTPAHNLALGDASGRARESRHQYGDAMDLIIDSDGTGRMGDLNHDGRVDVEDVRVIEAAVNRVEHAHPELAGGLGVYSEMGPSGPFAHIDVRGTRARWGTAGRGLFASRSSSLSSFERVASASSGHCQAEGASAVLCQGFRHTR